MSDKLKFYYVFTQVLQKKILSSFLFKVKSNFRKKTEYQLKQNGPDKDHPPSLLLIQFQVIDWEPIGLFAPSNDDFFSAGSLNQPMKKDNVYIRCADITKRDKGSEIKKLNFEYFGADGSLEKKFYPYQGKMVQENYDVPYMAVKVKNAQV